MTRLLRCLLWLLVFKTVDTICGVWSPDPGQSRMTFSVEVDNAPLSGTIGRIYGRLQFAGDMLNPELIELCVPAQSLSVGFADADTRLHDQQFLDAAAWPWIFFHSTRIVRRETDFVAVGILTIKGIAREIKIPFTLYPRKRQLQARFNVHRLDFHVGEGEWQSTERIANTVTLNITLGLTSRLNQPQCPRASR